jgi:hypothetical protein
VNGALMHQVRRHLPSLPRHQPVDLSWCGRGASDGASPGAPLCNCCAFESMLTPYGASAESGMRLPAGPPPVM